MASKSRPSRVAAVIYTLNVVVLAALLSHTFAVVRIAVAARGTHEFASRRRTDGHQAEHVVKRKSSLKSGQILKSREILADGDLLLIMQEDCNLVLYRQNFTTGAIAVVWLTGTQSSNIDLCFLKLQRDGNLVIFLTTPGHKEDVTPYWASGGAGVGNSPYKLKFVPVNEASKFPGGVAIYDRDWNRTWSSFQKTEH